MNSVCSSAAGAAAPPPAAGAADAATTETLNLLLKASIRSAKLENAHLADGLEDFVFAQCSRAHGILPRTLRGGAALFAERLEAASK